MAMVVQHNMVAANTNRMLGVSVGAVSKSTEKLSSGYRINRAADDAAGLAISEKMRSQIRGLDKASVNASDGISMIQTAEGALTETHSILQRMRELAVQASNGTETDDDRSNIQDEIEQLQDEIDRIASDTEFNTMKLLDGSLNGSADVSDAGPKFGVFDTGWGAFVTSNVKDVQISCSQLANIGGESAIWSEDGKELTLNLAKDATYSQTEINNLIKNAKQEDSTASQAPAKVELNLVNGNFTASKTITGAKTVAGARATGTAATPLAKDTYVGISSLSITAKKYGVDNNTTIAINFKAEPGSEKTEITGTATYTTTGAISDKQSYTLSLATGKEYTEQDIEKLLAQAGFSAEVDFHSPNPDEPNTLMVTTNAATLSVSMSGGAGLGDTDAWVGQKKYDVSAGGEGVVLQVGANYGQTMSFSIGNMSSAALGVSLTSVNTSSQKQAMEAISAIDGGIAIVSKQRALLGAVQNRLEHTIASLDNTSENLQSAESGIRDTDMASEMVTYSKYNILQQAGQSMLAQANQANQGVLSIIQ